MLFGTGMHFDSTYLFRMMANCRKSCRSCQGGDRAWQLRQHIQTTYQNTSDTTMKNVRIESVRINNVEIVSGHSTKVEIG